MYEANQSITRLDGNKHNQRAFYSSFCRFFLHGMLNYIHINLNFFQKFELISTNESSVQQIRLRSSECEVLVEPSLMSFEVRWNEIGENY